MNQVFMVNSWLDTLAGWSECVSQSAVASALSARGGGGWSLGENEQLAGMKIRVTDQCGLAVGRMCVTH